MNLLLITTEIKERSQIINFSGVWSWYLAQALKAQGATIRFDERLPVKTAEEETVDHYRRVDVAGVDHVLALGQGYFDKIPHQCVTVLRSRVGGAVAQMRDRPHGGRTSVDITFTICGSAPTPTSVPVGWAADPDLCKPDHEQGELRILVDHPDYKSGRGDQTGRVLRDVQTFVRSKTWKNDYHAVRVRRLVDGGVEDNKGEVGSFHRRHVPYETICAEYSQTHVFLVTHRESVGLTALETAMAGALPVVPKDAICADRLNTVRHVEYSDRSPIPWRQVLSLIDIEASRGKAKENNWDRIAIRILQQLKSFQRKTAM